MKLPSDEDTHDQTMNTNSSHHIHSKDQRNSLYLNEMMKKELFKAIARKEALRLIKNTKLSHIAKYFEN